MKYIIKQINDDFLADELEQIRTQFIEGLNYSMESAAIVFDKSAKNPLDFYMAFDFQQKNGELVVYGFNLRDEIIKNFQLDINQQHSSKLLLEISQHLKNLAVEMEVRYTEETPRTIAELKQQQETEYAEKINRSYRDVLKDAIAKDQHAKHPNPFGEDGYQHQTILLKNKPES